MNDLVIQNGIYQTAAGRAGWLGRRLPSLIFYARLAPIVLKASHQARHGRYPNPVWCRSSCTVIAALEAVGVRFCINGIEQVAQTAGPCVFVGNHMSTLETLALPAMLLPYKKLTYIVKRSLVEYPVFRHVLLACRPITVERANPREDFKVVMSEGEARLKEGISVIVFPQTTRTEGFDPARFNTIGVKLAKRAGVPVIPMAIKTDAWGNGRWFKDLGRIQPAREVRFAFGGPLAITGSGQEEQAAVIAFIQEHLRRWQGK